MLLFIRKIFFGPHFLAETHRVADMKIAMGQAHANVKLNRSYCLHIDYCTRQVVFSQVSYIGMSKYLTRKGHCFMQDQEQGMPATQINEEKQFNNLHNKRIG
jgi:hypothetical protein